MKHLILFLSCITFLFNADLVAQSRNKSANNVSDTSHVLLTDPQSGAFTENRAIRIADSMRIATLERQIREMKSAEQTKNRKLLEEAAAIRDRDSAALAEQRQRIDSLRQIESGFAVAPFLTDTLFRVYSPLASFSAKSRSESQAKNIREMADDYFFDPDSLKTVSNEITTNLMYGDKVLLGITDLDALWEGVSREELARLRKDNIVTAVKTYRDQTNWKTLLIKTGIAILIIIALGVIIYLINKLFRWIRLRMQTIGAERMKGIRIKGYALLDTARELKIVLILINIIKWLTFIFLVYLSFPLLFLLFPWTEHLSSALVNLVLDPVTSILKALFGYLPNLITIIVIIIAFRFVLKGLRYLKNEIETESLRIPGFHPELANPTYQITRVLILAFMLVVIFPYLPGSDSPIFKGVSVFLGVLFTFGSSGSLSNLIAGLVLTYMRSFRIGDRIKVGNETGDVVEKGMLVTRIRTPKNEIISIPNSNALNSNLINYSSESANQGLIIYAGISIGYDAEWRQVHQLLLNAADATDKLEKDPAPFVLQTALDDFYVSYQINAYTKFPNLQASIYSQLFQNIQDQFNEAGVQIMSPHYEADKEVVVIPERYRRKPSE